MFKVLGQIETPKSRKYLEEGTQDRSWEMPSFRDKDVRGINKAEEEGTV